jgi:hypothetical protein
MATEREKSDNAFGAAPIVAGRHIRHQKDNKQSREDFQHLRTVLRDARAVRKISAQSKSAAPGTAGLLSLYRLLANPRPQWLDRSTTLSTLTDQPLHHWNVRLAAVPMSNLMPFGLRRRKNRTDSKLHKGREMSSVPILFERLQGLCGSSIRCSRRIWDWINRTVPSFARARYRDCPHFAGGV